MAKKTRSSRSAVAKSTQRKSTQQAKPRQSTKSGARKTKPKATAAAGRSAKKKTAAKKATPRGAAKKSSATRRGAATRSTKKRTGVARSSKTANRAGSARSTRRRAAETPGRAQKAGAVVDAWCEDCTAALRKLVANPSTKSLGRGSRKSKSSARQQAARQWVGATARQLGLGVRQGAKLADPRKILAGTGEKIRHIKFNDVSDFCKKEWKELAKLASKIDALANSRPPSEAKRTSAKHTRR